MTPNTLVRRILMDQSGASYAWVWWSLLAVVLYLLSYPVYCFVAFLEIVPPNSWLMSALDYFYAPAGWVDFAIGRSF